MATTILDEWTGYGLANGEHLDYSKAIVGALHGLDPAKVPVGGAGGRGHGANGRDQPVQTRRLAAHREKGEAGTGARSRLVSGNRPNRHRKQPLRLTRGLFVSKKGHAICAAVF